MMNQYGYNRCPCPDFQPSTQGGCSYCHFGKPGGTQGLQLAELSPREIKMINQYEADFYKKYGYSVVLVALQNKK
ncbi:MAG: hypothetical protein LBR56_01360 [Sporomusaceae bacterium]|jgi:hypothetical protein|nr:hypothetical protein [Sporomusaceae bacterium]